MKKYCFVFICQQGELEIKSMLLATSLKRYLRCEYELVAAIPEPTSRWGSISKNTLDLIQTLGVRTAPVINRIDENYPIGNKVACLGIETQAEKIVFLDSDILCLREFAPEFDAPFHAKPADLATFTDNISQWQPVYDLCQLSLPTERVISSTSGQLMLPYFNAGVIAVQNGLGFAQVWEACCQKIDAATSITKKRPWLDQIALPIAVNQLRLQYKCFDERFNYPAHLKPLPKSTAFLPFLCHYHWHSIIRREPLLNDLVKELANAYPLLEKLILNSDEWARLLKPYTLQKPPRRLFSRSLTSFKPSRLLKKPRNFLRDNRVECIITGIPRISSRCQNPPHFYPFYATITGTLLYAANPS